MLRDNGSDMVALRPVAEAAPIGIFVVQDGKFVYVNPQFALDTGFRPAEIIGRDSLALVVAEDREMVRASAIKMIQGVERSPYRFRIQTKQGSLNWIQSSVTSIRWGGRPATLGFFMDITAEKSALEAQSKQFEELQILLSISRILMQRGWLNVKVEDALREIARLPGVGQVILREPNDEANALRLVAAVGTGEIQRFLRSGMGVAGAAFQQRRLVIANDYVRFPGATPEALNQGMKSGMAIPLEVDGRIVAVISILSRAPDHFTPARVDLLATLAGVIGLFLAPGPRIQGSERTQES